MYVNFVEETLQHGARDPLDEAISRYMPALSPCKSALTRWSRSLTVMSEMRLDMDNERFLPHSSAPHCQHNLLNLTEGGR